MRKCLFKVTQNSINCVSSAPSSVTLISRVCAIRTYGQAAKACVTTANKTCPTRIVSVGMNRLYRRWRQLANYCRCKQMELSVMNQTTDSSLNSLSGALCQQIIELVTKCAPIITIPWFIVRQLLKKENSTVSRVDLQAM